MIPGKTNRGITQLIPAQMTDAQNYKHIKSCFKPLSFGYFVTQQKITDESSLCLWEYFLYLPLSEIPTNLASEKSPLVLSNPYVGLLSEVSSQETLSFCMYLHNISYKLSSVVAGIGHSQMCKLRTLPSVNLLHMSIILDPQ